MIIKYIYSGSGAHGPRTGEPGAESRLSRLACTNNVARPAPGIWCVEMRHFLNMGLDLELDGSSPIRTKRPWSLPPVTIFRDTSTITNNNNNKRHLVVCTATASNTPTTTDRGRHCRRRRPEDNDNSSSTINNSNNTMSGSPKMHPTYTNQPSLDLELAAGEDRQRSSEVSSSSNNNLERLSMVSEQASPYSNDDKNNKDVESGTTPLVKSETSGRRLYGNAAGFKDVTAVLLYSFCSISMILVNKSLATR